MSVLKCLLVSTFLSLAVFVTPANAVNRHHLVTPAQFRQALWVHKCEEGRYGWHVGGPMYYGGLGWRPATWTTFRASWMPTRMDLATPVEQAFALLRFAAKYGMPDLNGTCRGY